MAKTPHCIGWLDLEATGLFLDNRGRPDYTVDRILEVGLIVTDFDLDPLTGYHEVIKMDQVGADRIRGNDIVRTMHQKSGLLKDSVQATATVETVEQELIEVLRKHTTFDKGEFMLGGSGVGQYDFGVLRYWMPEFASYFAYYPADIGVFRRLTKILSGGKQFVNDTVGAYGDSKVHRAYEDVKTSVEEAKRYQEWLKSL